jgi:hypothetical protein
MSDEVNGAGDPPGALPPPRPLLWLAVASALLGILPMAFALHYGARWNDERRGKDIAAQRASLAGVTWFKRPFVHTLARLERIIPPGERVLLEPTRVATTSGQARWHLFFNHYGYPIRFYTRRSDWASGTLVDYPRWLAHHVEDDLSRLSLMERVEREQELLAAIEKHDIRWLLRYPVTRAFLPAEIELYRREGERWERVDLGRPVESAPEPEGDGALEFEGGSPEGWGETAR